MKRILYIIVFFICANLSFAQADTVVQTQPPLDAADTAANLQQAFQDTAKTDTTLAADTLVPVQQKVYSGMDSLYLKLLNNPYLVMKGKPVYLVIDERVRKDKDDMFYLFAGLLMYLAFIKLVWPRYFSNVFRLFFQPSFRQKQTREQLLQSALPSLLLNLFFILSGGAYIALLFSYYNVIDFSFWLLFLYGSLILLSLYTGKFLFITFAGWVFNVKQAAETYMFVVFLINKIIGVLLLPFLLVIAFSKTEIVPVAITISLILISILLMYRYIVSFAPVRREVKVSGLHFIFYVLAFEITPLLLIYKTLIIYLDKTL